MNRSIYNKVNDVMTPELYAKRMRENIIQRKEKKVPEEQPHDMIREEMTDDDARKLIDSLFVGTLLKMAILGAYGHRRSRGETPFQAFNHVVDSYERASTNNDRHLL